MLRYLWIVGILFLSGCATILSGTTQSITIDTLNVKGANCKGIDKKGKAFHWICTPASTAVHKGDGPMTIICEREGFKKTVYTTDEGLTTSFWGNIILGGGIGMLVDATSGAAQGYPTLLKFPMEPEDSAPEAAKAEYRKIIMKMQEEARRREEEKSGRKPIMTCPKSSGRG